MTLRIIPARAGFTISTTIPRGLYEDHPRSRGVYPSLLVTTPRVEGSSPLARGLLDARHAPPVAARIIPARAGFTRRIQPGRSATGDHPRSRGVYRTTPWPWWPLIGSSPLARGLLLHDLRGLGDVGIIPARAGFTPILCRRIRGSWDHPRSRGVYFSASSVPICRRGSSPLARGLLLQMGDHGGEIRIIPARAGFTSYILRDEDGVMDHPRSRGVYHRKSTGSLAKTGSSPLARGLHPLVP